MQVVKIEQAALTHLDAILELQAIAYTDELVEGRDVLGSRIEMGSVFSCVAMAGGSLAGYVLAHLWPDHSSPGLQLVLHELPPNSTVVHIHDMAVAPEFRGAGVAQALLNALESRARMDVESLTLVAVQGAERFWAKVGFEDEGPAAGYDTGARFMRKRLMI